VDKKGGLTMDKSEKLYYETLKEIKKFKEQIGDELDSLYRDLQNLTELRKAIRELQETVAKEAGVPVAMLFNHYRA
jgi:DNA repair ATPase RecN